MSVFIIAEAGVNHNGSISIAKRLIDIAAKAGADAVKFQTFKTENLVTKKAKKANYQKKNSNKDQSQFHMLKKLELTPLMHKRLLSYSKKKNILFLSSPFDLSSIDFLNNLKLKIFKIPSGEITNLPYLKKIGGLNKKIILSTGMSNMNEIKNAINILVKSGTKKKNITVLHANTEYPTPIRDVNLRSMLSIGKILNVNFGYSDHTLGFEVSVAAVALGASCIEKHFTLNSNMRGPDHRASLEPKELTKMINAIRNIEIALGSSIKRPSKSEIANIKIVRKSLVASQDIKKGEIFTEQNLTTKRPGTGLSPFKIIKFLGKRSLKNYKKDQQIK
ncbi:N-acetylneuraminate synthase [Candidatus Pelagibacter sp.]|uniref:N-acetylneuraminate synthase n=1 Tax=Candidatus Pelagibacter sp. TaxID=2024849 RepID=UPI003F870D71